MSESSPDFGSGEESRPGGLPDWIDYDPDRRDGAFDPAVLDRTVISVPLLKELWEEQQRRVGNPDRPRELFDVIIDLNWTFRGGRDRAIERISALVQAALSQPEVKSQVTRANQDVDRAKSELSSQYVFARLEEPVIRAIVRLDYDTPWQPSPSDTPLTGNEARAIHSIWPDFKVQPLLTKSYITVKADAARAAFSAMGAGIVWAVVDSGIDATHPHFARHKNLELEDTLKDAHRDFTPGIDGKESPLTDEYGHGTHVAGIIAGEMIGGEPLPGEEAKRRIVAVTRQRDEFGQVKSQSNELQRISGIAPRCRLLSLKALDESGNGSASNLIVALEHVHKLNGYGRRIVVHGVNMSVGYSYEPEWFACGQSPVCVEVNRLVRSGVVVVIAAGNTGYGWLRAAFTPQPVFTGMNLSINDPGNADLAITVGSTHRESPHVYGVSYFSSKGPTGDGRMKPDLVAPGEKIISCAAPVKVQKLGAKPDAAAAVYVEDSGTSMAAPHVSGAIAAFLSIRNEFIGRPEFVKEIFCSTATDLKRERTFQGHGLVDLMRAIQSV